MISVPERVGLFVAALFFLGLLFAAPALIIMFSIPNVLASFFVVIAAIVAMCCLVGAALA